MSLLKNSFCRSQRKNQILTHQEQPHTTQEAKTKKSFHIPFFNNTSKTAPAKDSTLQASSHRKSSVNMRRQNIVHRTDCRRNTIWSDTVEGELVANLSPRELNRQEVLFEIIKTESEYVRDLRLVEELFINPIKEAEKKHRKQIVPENLNKVFNSISYFLFIHEVINSCLSERQESQFPLVRSISDILLPYVWVFRSYAPYLIHYEDALRELDECIRKKDKLGKLVRKQQKQTQCRNMPLTTYLLKPFQRLLKYPLLITNLLKCTDKDSFDFNKTVSLKSKLDEVLSNVEEQKRSHDNMERLRELETRIHGLGSFRLAINNRQLLREVPACQNLSELKKQPSFRKSLTVTSAPMSSSKRHSVRNLYALECNDIVLLAERTGITKEGQPLYKLVSRPPVVDDEPVMVEKPEDSDIYFE
ncbi:13708_t:CDS:2 [Funneliformis geosporum]|uniref:16600_t:CDS:1 n=1 Tax=Funneliformis geosporum TaxID=1117311 RepID=A0A9W4SBH3_9GLOM|nr:13708_t:CDS:2 [Funneliformis geosporum]CAI2163715.1 16600_t:CDS:2 [Funneliformis geosporum]